MAMVVKWWYWGVATLALILGSQLPSDGGRLLQLFPAARAQQLQGSMPLGSSWTASSLSYLLSPGSAFALGWLQLPNASHNFYLAVWYASLDNTIVWVANRNSPAADNDTLHFTSDGNLLISRSANSSQPVLWQTSTFSSGVSSLQMLDSGNAVLLLRNGSYAWQSFSFPTDTFLPNQSVLVTQTLISRPPSYSTSLASGNFKLYFDQHGMAAIDAIDKSGKSIITVWTPLNAIVVPVGTISSRVIAAQFTNSGVFFMYNISNGNAYSNLVASDYPSSSGSINPTFRRLTLDPDGNLRMYGWDYSSGTWVVLCKAISDLCSTMCRSAVPMCGSYGVCVDAPEPACTCFPGFHPTDVADFSLGCTPDDHLQPLPSCAQNQSGINNGSIGYLRLRNTDFWGNDIIYEQGIALQDCLNLCNRYCSCIGFIYDSSGFARCWLKEKLLNGYGPQNLLGPATAYIKLWNYTASPFINLPEQPAILTWIANTAFWSETLLSSNLTCNSNPIIINNSTFVNDSTSCPSTSSHRHAVIAVSAISAGELLLFLLALFLLQQTDVCRRGRGPSSLQHPGCRAFTYAELVEATQDFRQPLGAGAYGAVFKGVLPDRREVAVKRLMQTSLLRLVDTQFKAEIATIGRIHHVNLLPLYGYCAEDPHRLLVYEFMENGSLDKFLFIRSTAEGDQAVQQDVDDERVRWLDWKTRFSICLGTARGLAYLHEDCLECILHCDIKPENILLDKDFCPKVADFGLAYLLGRNETLEVSNVRGTRGYLAPEWLGYLQITPHADVYSYGMVLIEIVSGRRNFMHAQSAIASETWEFPAWALRRLQSGRVAEVVDPRIRQEADLAQVESVLQIAFLCLHGEARARPSMKSIVQMLQGSNQVPILDPTSPGSFQHHVQTGSEFLPQRSGFHALTSSSSQPTTTSSSIEPR